MKRTNFYKVGLSLSKKEINSPLELLFDYCLVEKTARLFFYFYNFGQMKTLKSYINGIECFQTELCQGPLGIL